MNHNEAVDRTLSSESQLAQHKATIDRLEEELREIKQQLSKVTDNYNQLHLKFDESAYDNYSSVCMELSQANQQLNELKELCAIFDEYLGPVHGADVPLMTRLRDVFSGLLNAYLKLRAKQLPPD